MDNEPALQTSTRDMEILANVVAFRLTQDQYSGSELIRRGFSRRRAERASRLVVPLVVEACRERKHLCWVLVDHDRCCREVEGHVRASLGFVQYWLLRALIVVIIKLVVRWWFSDRGADMREANQ